MLKIQVLGNGMVPRLGRLGPIKDPFPADKTLIATIIATSRMKINYLDPKTNKMKPLSRDNLNEIWEMYGEAEYDDAVTPKVEEVPPVKEEKKEVKEEQKVEPPVKNETKPEEKSEEKSEDEILEEMIKEEEKNKSDKNKKKH